MYSKINKALKNKAPKVKSEKFKFFSRERLSGRLLFVITSITIVSFIFLLGIISNVVTSSTKRQYINSANQILEQNKNHIEYLTKSINNYAIQIISDRDLVEILKKNFKDDYDKLVANKALDSKISSIVLSNDIISNVYIIITDKINYGYPNIKQDITLDKVPYYQEFINSNKINYWTPPIKLNIGYRDEITISSYSVVKDLNSEKQLGLLIVSLKPSQLSKALIKNNDGSTMFIVDENGLIVAHPDTSLIGKSIAEQKKMKFNGNQGSFYYKDNTGEKFVVYTTEVSQIKK